MSRKKRRFGDRYDGRLLRNVDPFYKIIPYIMKSRVDSQVFFNEKIIFDKIEPYLHQKRKEGYTQIGFLHIITAAMVRMLSQRPRINRFVCGNKIYARNEITISLAVKKDMRDDSPETTIKVKFEPTDTINDVIDKMNKAINENKKLNEDNDTDKTAKWIMRCPGFLVNFFVGLIKWLDRKGRMPKAINKVSPFHTSFFITDVGSLGVQPVYHHIYEFGTTSIFLAFGYKNKEKYINDENQVTERKYVDLKIVVDERICDGFYYAKSFRLLKRLMENPVFLEKPPQKVYEDDEV